MNQIPATRSEYDRTALTKDALKQGFLDNLYFLQGKFPSVATNTDYYLALAYTVRDRMLHRWISTASAYTDQGVRTVCYLSAEFLMGPHLGNNLINMGIYGITRTMVERMGGRTFKFILGGYSALDRQTEEKEKKTELTN